LGTDPFAAPKTIKPLAQPQCGGARSVRSSGDDIPADAPAGQLIERRKSRASV
jgi:hypothetical protein